MRIVHVVTAVQKAGGGTSEVIPRICEGLAAAGHDVRLVSGAVRELSDSAVRARAAGVDMRFPPITCIPHIGFLRATAAFRKELAESIRWCDIVHIHGHWQDVPWAAVRLARELGKPYVMQPHGFLEPERLKKSAVQKKVIGALIERPNLNHASLVVATAESEKLGIRRFGVTRPIEVVPIGLDTDCIDRAQKSRELLQRLGLDANRKTLLYFSRLTPIKGLDLLADAWSMLDKYHDRWQLLIAGPDDRGYAQEIKKYYNSRIKDNSVVFHGPVYGADKYALLKSVDAFVLPTRSENWSIAVQEALAAGLPTVCTKGAPWGVIEREHAGYWVDVDAEPIRDGLERLMCLNDEMVYDMAEKGKRIVARDFNWLSISHKLIALYERYCRSDD